MFSSILNLLLILCLIFFSQQLLQTNAQEVFACFSCINSRGNYTTTSAYHDNLNKLLSLIYPNTQITNGFYNFSVGENSNKVYGIAVCRGDFSTSDCQTCLNDATKRLPGECTTQKEAIGYYYPRCMLHYSDRPIFGIKELTPNCSQQSPYKIPPSDKEKFGQQLSNLFDGLRINASSGGSSYKFATGVENVSDSSQVYGLMQCNPDLLKTDCSNCLEAGVKQLKVCCNSVNGAGVYGPSCGVQFDNYPFFNLQVIPPSASGLATSKPGKGRATQKFWIIIVGLLVVVILLAILVFWLSRRKKPKIQLEDDNKIQITCVDSLQFDFSTIQVATNNFSDANKLGKGSSATVYKGILPGEQLIAVKRFGSDGKFGELEFNNEVLLLADLQHRNLVKLLGFCVEEDSRFLIYEYLLNGSLDWFLEDPINRAKLSWETRHKIILGIARGLLYLHEDSQLRVIHRDLKPSNILLDVDMNPKITNFSRASLVQVDQTRGDSSIVLGTYGYMPPEYVEQGHFSAKSDVFSFGILLLEIITGQLIDNFCGGEKGESLPSFVWRKWSECKASDAIDQALTSAQKHTTQILGCMKMALLCVQENSTSRPTMSTVVFMLNSNLITNENPSRPAYIICSDTDLSSSSTSSQKYKVNETSVNGASISQLDPR